MPSDNGMTAAEQSALDADKAAEVAEETPAAPTTETPANDTQAGEAAETETGQDNQPQRQGMVPHAALHEERTKRQETERQLAEARRERQTLEERTNLILQRFAQPQQQPATAQTMPEIPAFDQDPAGHILGQVRQQGAILGELVQAVTGQNRQNAAAAGVQQLTARAAAMEREFAAATPDYDKASSHLFEARRQELIAAGWDKPEEIETAMVHEARGLAARAMQQGKNPAAVVYALAKLRGYTGAPPADNGAAEGEGQLRTIAAGQQQSRTTGNLRGSGPAPLTATKLADMDEADFLKMIGTPEGKGLMGS